MRQVTEPRILAETETWALLFKPHGLPSAPLQEGEADTLLSWFLTARPQGREVAGRKAIEHGLIHRLDTGTAGLVLVAKKQNAYDRLQESQKNGLICKRYEASCLSAVVKGPVYLESVASGSLPRTITSGFRPFGPKGRAVRPVFPGDARYTETLRQYSTTIDAPVSVSGEERGVLIFRCSLVLGYRHQVRSHLACIGYPIIGDALYNPVKPEGPLSLTATQISFPDPDSGMTLFFSLPQQDRTSR